MTRHINLGTDTTINPVVIDDSYRSKKMEAYQRYWCTKDQLDKLIFDLDYRRYNLAKITEDEIRTQIFTPTNAIHTQAHPPEAQQRVDDAIKIANDAISIAKVLCLSNVSRQFTLDEVIPKLEQRIALLQEGRK